MKEIKCNANGEPDPNGSFYIPVPDDYESSARPAGSTAIVSKLAAVMVDADMRDILAAATVQAILRGENEVAEILGGLGAKCR